MATRIPISGSFKNVTNKTFTHHIYLMYMYKEDLALIIRKWLICHETKQKSKNQHYSFVCRQLNGFKYCYVSLTIQLNISHLLSQFKSQSSIWPIDMILSDVSNSDPSGAWNYGNEEVLHIPQSSSITGTPPSDYLVPYPGDSLGEVSPLCRRRNLQPEPTRLMTSSSSLLTVTSSRCSSQMRGNTITKILLH